METKIKPTILESETDLFAQKKEGRILGGMMLLFQIGLLIAYGFSGSFYTDSSSSKAIDNDIYYSVIMAMFVIIGFGMLLSIYKYGTQLGITSAIVVVAISIQLAPLLQKYWFNVFIGGFKGFNPPEKMGLNVQRFWTFMSSGSVIVTSEVNRVTYLSCISILTMMTSLVGRVSLSQLCRIVIVYQAAWNLNYYLLIYLCVIVQDHNDAAFTPFFFDQFGSTFVYLFAAFYGLILSLGLRKPQFAVENQKNISNKLSLVMSLTGAAFIFASFIFAYSNVVAYQPFSQNLIRFNILWALTGSVLGTYIGSVIFGKGQVGMKEAIIGTISGGVMMGSIAPIQHIIGISIAIGVVSGVISGIYYSKVERWINNEYIYDSLGLFGPFLLSAFLGSFVVTPIVLACYSYSGTFVRGVGSSLPIPLIGWQLIYVGITAGIALVGGLLSALLCWCNSTASFDLGSGFLMLSGDFGLYKETEEPIENKNQMENMPESSKIIILGSPLEIKLPPSLQNINEKPIQ